MLRAYTRSFLRPANFSFTSVRGKIAGRRPRGNREAFKRSKPDHLYFNESPEKYRERVRLSKLYSIAIGGAVGTIGCSYIWWQKFKKYQQGQDGSVKACSAQDGVENPVQSLLDLPLINTDTPPENVDGGDAGNTEAGQKKRVGFRKRKIIEYEDRIREYSTPDKIFRYFATVKISHPYPLENEIYMRPEDFVRSLTPGTMQTEGLGLDQFENFRPEKHKYKSYLDLPDPENSVFRFMGKHSLISFTDYIFLLTVLGTPSRHIEIAFRMFDINGDGEVSPDEFAKVQSTLLNMTTTGSRHRDRSTTGNIYNSSHMNNGLMEYFFGKNQEHRLTAEEFIKFQHRLQNEVMYLEFTAYEPEDGRISERKFARMLLTYATFSEKKKEKILKRIKVNFKEDAQGITFKDYQDFFSFLSYIQDVDTALSFHSVAERSITQETFKRVAKMVSGMSLSDHVIDVVFKMFDENDDGELSHKEFVAVMKNQLMRGLDKPKDTGFTRLMSAVWHCALKNRPAFSRE